MPNVESKDSNQGNYRLLACLLLVGGGFMVPTGYQMTNVNIAQPKFISWLAKITGRPADDLWVVSLWSTVVSSRLIGNVVGAGISSFLADSLGRRNALMWVTLPMIIGDLLAYTTKFSNSVSQLMVARLMSGFADGAIWNCLVVFFTEVSPAEFRGRIGASLMILREVGMLIGIAIGFPQALGSENHMFHIFLVSLVMECMLPGILLVFPESPRYLYINKKNYQSTGKSLEFYNGSQQDFSAILEDFEQAEKQLKSAPSLKEQISTREFKLAILLSICFGSSFGFAGRFVLLNYSSGLLQSAGFSTDEASMIALVIQFLPIPVGLIDIPIVDRYGRRPILIIASLCTIILELGIYILFRIQADFGYDSVVIKYAIGAMVGAWEPIMIGGLMCLHFVPSELFSQNTRALGFSIHTLCWFLMGALTTQVFEVLQALGPGYGIFFLVVPFFALAVVLMLFMPETKNRSVEAIAADMHTLKIHSPVSLILKKKNIRHSLASAPQDIDDSPTAAKNPRIYDEEFSDSGSLRSRSRTGTLDDEHLHESLAPTSIVA